jgi:hypothetical protein
MACAAADPGQTHNTGETLRRLIDSNPQLVILLADFTYADNWKNADQFPPPDSDFVTCELQQQGLCNTERWKLCLLLTVVLPAQSIHAPV